MYGYTWVIDFFPFENNGSLGVNGLAVGSCENRANSTLLNHAFSEFFNSALRSDKSDLNGGKPDSLNSDNYLSYKSSGSIWEY